MCGITAALARGTAALEPERVRQDLARMTRAIAHRGPDGEAHWHGQRAALGHRRLAVLDLETGDQPMSSADGRVHVVFNGEIYNHHELRAELEAQGCVFRTRCDTEVLVHGMRVYGRQLAAKLIGMFAFVAHDEHTGETLVARDPVGQKPLFFTEHGGMWLLASEVRCFLALEGFGRAIDPGALREYLALRYVPGSRTLLTGIHEIPPGSQAWHRPGEAIVTERYWEPRFEPDHGQDTETVAGELRELIRTAVADRLEADVPLGAFLSGGVDSSAVVHAMAGVSAQQVQAVTVGFDDARFDERPYAREFAERVGIRLFEEVCHPDPETDLPVLTELLDLPQTDDSIWPTWLVCKVARSHVTVALSGDGGDESFAGYRRQRFDLMENRLRAFVGQGPAGVLARVAPKGDWLPRPLRFKRTLQNLARDPAEAYFRSVSSLLPEEVAELVSPDVAGGVDPFRELRAVYEASSAPDHGSRVLDLDLRTWLPGQILPKVDRASMNVSLEVRAPFLDRRILDFAGRLPHGMKVDRSGGKKVLKQALEPWLGRAWMQRPKMGFSIPLADWLRGPLRDVREDAIHGTFARRFLQTETLQRWAREHDSGRRDRSEALWAVLVLHRWNDRWGHQA